MQVGRTLRASFTLPRLATDGEQLTKPLEVELLRAAFPPGQAASGGQENLLPWRSFAPAEVEKHKRGSRFELTLPLSAEEFSAQKPLTLRFGVRTLTRGFRGRPVTSEVSNVVQLSLLEVPASVQGLQARTTERAIELRWAAPAPPVSAYRVYRSLTGEPDSFVLAAESAETTYRDGAFAFGRTYFYKVAAIVKEGGLVAASEDSPVVEVQARDTFPPAAPQGLTALYTSRAVELIWNASTEPDLDGYNVYRQEEGGAETRLTPQPLATPIFRDTAVAVGRKYTYRVTAVDLAHNESPPSAPAAAAAPAW